MKAQIKNNKPDSMGKYVTYSSPSFLALILVLGGMASMGFDAPLDVMIGIALLGNWSPAIVLLLMMKNLKPGMTIGDFYKKAFQESLNIPLFIAIPVIAFGIFLASVWLLSIMKKHRSRHNGRFYLQWA